MPSNRPSNGPSNRPRNRLSDDADEKLAPPESRKRLVWSVGLAAGAVLAATVAIPTYADGGDRSGADRLEQQHTGAAQTVTARTAPRHDHSTQAHSGLAASADGHTHDHSDPATKNAVSRSTGDTVDAATKDPTTARQAAAARKAVAAQRAEPDPELVPVARQPRRRAVPEDRYAMAGGCYALRAAGNDRWVTRDGDGFSASARRIGGEPFHFQATDLGKYLLFGSEKDFVAKASGGPIGLTGKNDVESADQPSERADWTVTRRGSSYLFTLPDADQGLAVNAVGDLVMAGTADPFELHRTNSCARWPEVETNVSGRPFRGASDIQEVRGYVDAHTHGMAFEFLGGEVHCGRPWHPYGVEAALVDCEDHQVGNGNGAVLENVLKNGQPTGSHDPVGWPTFKDWPAPNSLTHEGTYYKWMERSYRGGLRLFVNLLVENGKLCELYPLKRNSCDEMTSIRLQAKRMRQFERYTDAQAGGPGEGWYRIVTSPFQARRVINEGKLAVVMGIETSVLFGCTMKADIPQCDNASIDRQLADVYKMGVRQMELVNKFDSALSGVAGDEGTTGVAVNSANFLETGSFWAMKSCPEGYAKDVHDKEQIAPPGELSNRDALFGAIAQAFGPPVALPLYPVAPHCNARALTGLGEHTIRQMVKRNMIFDPDHMSVSSRKASLDLLETLDYPGVVSSHSWSTPDAYPRIYRLGGVVTPYAGDSTGFVEKWKCHLGWADGRYYFGFGFGADINGLGAQGDPRGADVPNPVTYPFRGLGGVTIGKQHSGKRVYDINVDGVAHYGLYPDWVEDLRKLAGNAIVQDMARGPEAYLQMWERAVGVSNDGCHDAAALKRTRVFRNLARGTSVKRVLLRAGQPHSRLDDTFTYCARMPSGRKTTLQLAFNDRGRLTQVV